MENGMTIIRGHQKVHFQKIMMNHQVVGGEAHQVPVAEPDQDQQPEEVGIKLSTWLII